MLVVAGCSGRREMAAHLSDIASYINDKPDSALTELRAIDTTSFHSRRNKAQHSLLHAMALDKCFIDITSDSIISTAARYYRHHGNPDEKMLALLYKGKARRYNGDLKEAAILYSQAEGWAEKATDRHSKAVLYFAITSLYNAVHNLEKEQEYVEKALAVLEGTGDPFYEQAFARLAIPYMMRREWSTADSLFRRGLKASEGYPEMMNFVIYNYGRMKMLQDKPDPEGAIALFKRKIEEYGGSLRPAEAGAYAYASARLGDDATADALIRQFKKFQEKDWNAVLPWMYRISAWRGDYESAYKYINEAGIHQESTVQSTLTDSITQTIQDYREKSLEQEKAKRRTTSLIFISLLLLAAVIILVTALRKRSIQNEVDSLLNIHESLKMEHEALKTSNRKMVSTGNRNKDRLQEMQVRLQKERLDAFRQRRVFDYVLWMNENNLLSDANTLKEFKEEMMSFYKTERNQKELEKVLDETLDGLISDLKRDLGITKPEEVHFLCLWVLDTKATVVAEILGMNDNTVYIRRSRLKNRILSLEDKYSFLLC
jgi:tetratricopeptide (TPR) repeat protein